MGAKVHPTAILHERVELADDAVVGPYCIVGPDVTIGAGTKLLDHVVIRGKTTIGKGNTFHPFSVIGEPPQDFKFRGEPSEVIIGDNNVLREMVTVNRGTDHGGGKTIVGNNNFLMACSHVAHDCFVENNVILANCSLLAGHVKVEEGAYISGSVVIHHFATIGKFAFIGGDTRIPSDAPPFMIVQGPEPLVCGPNVVGLKRNGYSPETVEDLKKSYQILWRKKLPQSEAIRQIRTMNGSRPEVQYLLEFLERSARGKNGRAREILRDGHCEMHVQ